MPCLGPKLECVTERTPPAPDNEPSKLRGTSNINVLQEEDQECGERHRFCTSVQGWLKAEGRGH